MDSNKQRHLLSISICWNLCSSIFTAEFRKFYFPVNIFALLTKQTNVFVLCSEKLQLTWPPFELEETMLRSNGKIHASTTFNLQNRRTRVLFAEKGEFRLFEICALLRNLNSPPNDQSSATRKCKTGNNANKTKWINNLFFWNRFFLILFPACKFYIVKWPISWCLHFR